MKLCYDQLMTTSSKTVDFWKKFKRLMLDENSFTLNPDSITIFKKLIWSFLFNEKLWKCLPVKKFLTISPNRHMGALRVLERSRQNNQNNVGFGQNWKNSKKSSKKFKSKWNYKILPWKGVDFKTTSTVAAELNQIFLYGKYFIVKDWKNSAEKPFLIYIAYSVGLFCRMVCETI